jgi:hypothetical protein
MLHINTTQSKEMTHKLTILRARPEKWNTLYVILYRYLSIMKLVKRLSLCFFYIFISNEGAKEIHNKYKNITWNSDKNVSLQECFI